MRCAYIPASFMQPGALRVFLSVGLRRFHDRRFLAVFLGIFPISWTFGATVDIPSGSTVTFHVPAGPDRVEPTTTFAGGGTLLKTGAGQLRWGQNQAATFAMGTGSLIDI